MSLEFINSLDVGTNLEDKFCINTCDIKNASNGNYLVGNFVRKEVIIPYKVWGNSSAYPIMQDSKNTVGKICKVNGVIKDYNGKYLEVKTIEFVENESMGDYLENKYNFQAYEKLFWKTLEANVSPKGIAFLNKFLKEDNPDIYDRFSYEFAAQKFHDNCLNGLFAHTCKCLTHLANYIKVYPQVYRYRGEDKEQDIKDLLFISMTLHDIGKINEMEYGIYTSRSFLTHRFLGVEMLLPYRDYLIENYSIEWCDHFFSVITQHHGVYAEEARTLPAIIIHLIDNFESTSTYISEQLKGNIEQHNCGETIRYQMPAINRMPTPFYNIF